VRKQGQPNSLIQPTGMVKEIPDEQFAIRGKWNLGA
jgi:hypothetical protein